MCTGQFAWPPVYSCACLPGFSSSTGNGMNCIAMCASDSACGSNANCNVGAGTCACNPGYYSPTATGQNCTAASVGTCFGVACPTGDPSNLEFNGQPFPGPSGTGMYCGAMGLVDLNCALPTTTTLLSVRFNSITVIPADSFQNLPSLLTLLAGYNSLTYIAPNAFAALTSLENLLIMYTQLTSLPLGVFNGLSNLALLEMTGNMLTSLQAGLFSPLLSLQMLYFDNNQITSLPSNLFNWIYLTVIVV